MSNNNLVLWGHSLADYREMFDLRSQDLEKTIIDCGAGPASFGAEMHQRGHDVLCTDRMYSKSFPELQGFIEKYFDDMLAQVKRNQAQFNWQQAKSVDALAAERRAGVELFLSDFQDGVKAGRYRANQLTDIDCPDASFELALCSHHLFSYEGHESLDFHIAAIAEMARVAHEVRIFPLLDDSGDITPLLGPVMLALQQNNMGVEVREVPYQLQKKGNAMLKVYALQCEVA